MLPDNYWVQFLVILVISHIIIRTIIWTWKKTGISFGIMNWYVKTCQQLLPDTYYWILYRGGYLSNDNYRVLQKKGIIDKELDPEYIQRWVPYEKSEE